MWLELSCMIKPDFLAIALKSQQFSIGKAVVYFPFLPLLDLLLMSASSKPKIKGSSDSIHLEQNFYQK